MARVYKGKPGLGQVPGRQRGLTQIIAAAGQGRTLGAMAQAATIEAPVLDPKENAKVNPVTLTVNLKAGFPLGEVKSVYHDVDIANLDDLSRRLPEDTYLERLQIDDAKAQLQGQSKEAAKLIALIGASDCLSNPSLQGQIQPDARTGKERFQITADVKPCNAPAFGANAAAATGKAGATHANATAGRAESKAPPKAIEKPVPASPETSKPASSKPVPSKPAAPKADASKPASQQKAATPTRPNATTPAKPLSQPKAATAPSKPSGTPPAARAGAQKPHEAVSGPRVPHEARVPREKEKTPASNALQEAAHGDH